MPPIADTFRAGPLPDTVLPEYSGRGLANVVPTVERHFGLDLAAPPLLPDALPPRLLEGARRVVTLLIDALGWLQLERALRGGHAPRIAALLKCDTAHLAPLTSVFPSTTVCALTTVGSGLPPGEHGVTSQYIYDAALGTVIDVLSFSPVVAGYALDRGGVEAPAWVGLPTVYERLGPRGVSPVVVNHRQFENTALSRINHRGARYIPFLTLSDLATNLRAVLEGPAERAYIHAYWGTLDTVAHEYGTHSPQHTAEIRAIDFALGALLLEGLRAPDTLLLVLADHGHIDTPGSRVIWLNDHPELLGLLAAPPAGLDRAGVLYVRPGREEDAAGYIRDRLGEIAVVLPAAETYALYGGGELSERARQRIGQLLILPRGDWRVKYQPPGRERKARHGGNHGGLSPEEMLVPLLALRLE